MIMSTGFFTALKAGIYHFSASFVKAGGSLVHAQLMVVLRVYGQNIAEANIYLSLFSAFTSTQASLKFKKGDRIDLYFVPCPLLLLLVG